MAATRKIPNISNEQLDYTSNDFVERIDLVAGAPCGALSNSIVGFTPLVASLWGTGVGSLNGAKFSFTVGGATQEFTCNGATNTASQNAFVTAINTMYGANFLSVNKNGQPVFSSASTLVLNANTGNSTAFNPFGLPVVQTTVTGTTAETYMAQINASLAQVAPGYVPQDAFSNVTNVTDSINHGACLRGLRAPYGGAGGTVIVDTPYQVAQTINLPLWPEWEPCVVYKIRTGGTATAVEGGV